MSQTVIESLIIRLGLDPSGLNKAPAAIKQVKELETQAKRTELGFDELAKGLTKFLAILGGTAALKIFITDMIDSTAAVERFSRNINLSVATVTEWGNAVQEVGGSAKDAQGSLDLFARAQTEVMLTGQSSLIPYLSTLGVSLADVHGKARPVDQILLDLSDRFSGLDRQTANNFGRMMGIDQNTLNLLLQGRHEVELNLKRQKEYAEQVSKFAPEATKLQRSLVDLKQHFTLLGLSLLQQAAPGIEYVLGLLGKFVNWANQNKEFIADFFKVMAVGLGAVALAALPLDLTIAAVLALGAAIALLWQDYQVWKRGGDSLIDWSKWEPGINAAIAGMKKIGQVFRNEIGPLAKLAEAGGKLLGGDVAGAKKAYWEIGNMNDPIISGIPAKSGGGETLQHVIERIEGEFAKGKMPNRPQRDNNPGNIRYGDFAKNHGSTGPDKDGYAVFSSREAGEAALTALLKSSSYANLTVPQAISRYAPKSDNNNTAAYTASVLKGTGASSSATVAQLLAGAGVNNGGGSSSVDKSVAVTTGPVTINTKATDADGIASEFKNSMYYLFASQANLGLN